jgi:hypothetical protein
LSGTLGHWFSYFQLLLLFNACMPVHAIMVIGLLVPIFAAASVSLLHKSAAASFAFECMFIRFMQAGIRMHGRVLLLDAVVTLLNLSGTRIGNNTNFGVLMLSRY